MTLEPRISLYMVDPYNSPTKKEHPETVWNLSWNFLVKYKTYSGHLSVRKMFQNGHVLEQIPDVQISGIYPEIC